MQENAKGNVSFRVPPPEEQQIERTLAALDSLERQERGGLGYSDELSELRSRIGEPLARVIQEDQGATEALEEAKRLRFQQVSEFPELDLPEAPQVASGLFLGSYGGRVTAPYDVARAASHGEPPPTAKVVARESGIMEIELHSRFQPHQFTAVTTIGIFVQPPIFLNRAVMTVNAQLGLTGRASIETLLGAAGTYHDEITLSVVGLNEDVGSIDPDIDVKNQTIVHFIRMHGRNVAADRRTAVLTPEVRSSVSPNRTYAIYLEMKMRIWSGPDRFFGSDNSLADVYGRMFGWLPSMDIAFAATPVPVLDLSSFGL